MKPIDVAMARLDLHRDRVHRHQEIRHKRILATSPDDERDIPDLWPHCGCGFWYEDAGFSDRCIKSAMKHAFRELAKHFTDGTVLSSHPNEMHLHHLKRVREKIEELI